MKILKAAKEFVLLTFGMLLLVSNVSAGNKDAAIKIINAEQKIFTLNIEGIKSKKYLIEIRDVYGSVLLQQKVSARKQSSKVYNFSKLPIGKYEIQIEGDTYVRKQFVNVLLQKIEVVAEEEVKIFKPSVELEENRIAFNMFSYKQNTVQVSILDTEGNLIFKEDIKDKLAIHKFYDLVEVPKGAYTVRIDTQGDSFYKSINL